MQYIGLLQEGCVEEFFVLVSDQLPLFSSLFVLEDGFLVFALDAKPEGSVLRDFCAHLNRLVDYSEDLGLFWKSGLFDRLVFEVFGDVIDCSDFEKEVVVEASLRCSSIPSGTFMMGALDRDEDEDADDCEKPRHQVTLTRGFEMCTYLCTQALYESVMGTNPSGLKGATRPVEDVSWCDAVLFCNKLSVLQGLRPVYILSETVQNDDDWSMNVVWKKEANGYRLPTEAEWEYCARAGEYTLYSGSDNIDDVGWYDANSDYKTHPVGQKKANAFGLYDMSGSVHEWCWDWFGDYNGSDNQSHAGRTERALRGGDCYYFASGSRVSCRYRNAPERRYSGIGFRLVRSGF